MRLIRAIFALTVLSTLSAATAATAAAPASAVDQPGSSVFDPARHMRVAEVRPGMKGYGLSVFRGTAIERFDVEVLSILRNFNPKYDVILVRCHGANLEHTGAIAGMSGSPIYLYDDQGRARMAGAFAYGWPLMKDPVGGVQPIEYMLSLPTSKPPLPPLPPPPSLPPLAETPTTRPADGSSQGQAAATPVSDAASAKPRATWSLDEVAALPGMKEAPPRYPLANWNVFAPNPRLSVDNDDATRLQPLATPLMAAGMSPELLKQFGPIFRAYGLVPLQAGGIGGSAAATTQPAGGAAEADLAPGSVLAVPLITGDMELTALGTCTEVLGNRVYGFGHAFQNEGSVTLPLGAGTVHAVIANLSTSFKLGALTRTRGVLATDQTVGIAGTIGQLPAMAPIDLHVVYADGSYEQDYHFDAALHPRFTPVISAATFSAACSGARELPQYHTLDYSLDLTFANGKVVHIVNNSVNASPAELFFEVGTPLLAAADNPFERVLLKSIKGTIRVLPEAREAKVLSVNLPREKFRPGETVKAYVSYRPFRSAEAILPVELPLPRDLPDGKYQLLVTDWQRFMEDERTAKPFRFTAQSIDEVFDVLTDVASIRHNALYLRLVRQADGVAIGRTAMAYLPSSRREVLLGAGRSDTTPFVSSTVKSVPTDLVMNGSAQFALTIDQNAKVEVGGQRPAKREAKEKDAALHKGDGPDKDDAAPKPPEDARSGGPEQPAEPAPAPDPGN